MLIVGTYFHLFFLYTMVDVNKKTKFNFNKTDVSYRKCPINSKNKFVADFYLYVMSYL